MFTSNSNQEVNDWTLSVFSYYEEMCKLAKYKKAPKFFILDILEEGFWCGLSGYLFANSLADLSMMKKFKEGCDKFSKIGEIISKIAYGEDHSVAKDWKERNQNFENWLSKYKKSHDDVNQFWELALKIQKSPWGQVINLGEEYFLKREEVCI